MPTTNNPNAYGEAKTATLRSTDPMERLDQIEREIQDLSNVVYSMMRTLGLRIITESAGVVTRQMGEALDELRWCGEAGAAKVLAALRSQPEAGSDPVSPDAGA